MKKDSADHTVPIWGKRLKEARLAAGLSQKQLGIAAELDEFVASPRINRYELGVHQPDYLIAKKLAKVLKVPVAYLYCDDDRTAKMLLAFDKAPVGLKRQALQVLEASAD